MATQSYIPRQARITAAKGAQGAKLQHGGGLGKAFGGGSEGGSRGGGAGGGETAAGPNFDAQGNPLVGGTQWHGGGGSGILGAVGNIAGLLGAFDRKGQVDPNQVEGKQLAAEFGDAVQKEMAGGASAQQALHTVLSQPGMAARLMTHPEIGQSFGELLKSAPTGKSGKKFDPLS